MLTDGVVELSAFLLDDVEAHLAGEDEASVRWLTDGQASTVASTTAWAQRGLDAWRTGGPTRLFAVRDAASGRLAGMIEANLDSASCGLAAGEANLSYMVQPWVRGRAYAARAVDLVCAWLGEVDGVEVAVLRVHHDNAASLRVAAKAGFNDAGSISTPGEGRLRCFRRRLTTREG